MDPKNKRQIHQLHKSIDPEVCKLKHEVIDKEINQINNKINEHSVLIDKTDNLIEENTSQVKDKIIVTKESLSSRIDSINEIIVGSKDKIGILENIRRLQWGVCTLFVLVGLLIGGKISGIGIDDIKQFLFKDTEKQVKENIQNKDMENEDLVDIKSKSE